MAKKQEQGLWTGILAALGMTSVALYFQLHRFLWRLWLALSGIWVVILVLLGSAHTDRGGLLIEEPVYWAIILAPPILLLLIASLLAWIIDGLRHDGND